MFHDTFASATSRGHVPVTINTIMEQENTFVCLGRKISYEEKKDVTLEISKFLQILGFLNNILKPNFVRR
jgi:hypothetical protein